MERKSKNGTKTEQKLSGTEFLNNKMTFNSSAQKSGTSEWNKWNKYPITSKNYNL
jgi:hypothetical protein